MQLLWQRDLQNNKQTNKQTKPKTKHFGKLFNTLCNFKVKEYRKKLLVLAKNDAKQRLHNYNNEVNDLSQVLRSMLSE